MTRWMVILFLLGVAPLLRPQTLSAQSAWPPGAPRAEDLRRLPPVGLDPSYDVDVMLPGVSPPPPTRSGPTRVEPLFELPPLEGPALETVLAEDVEPAPSGWYPYAWMRPDTWSGGVELGLNGKAGNAEALSLRAGADIQQTTDWYEWTTDLTYSKATADGRETQHDALFHTGYERPLADLPWAYFGKLGLEYDEFKAFDLRVAINTGVTYRVVDLETITWKLRFGGGASHEIGGPDDRWKPEALFGSDYEHQLTERQKLTAAVDYFPAWDDFTDYRLTSDLGWQVLLDEAHNLSLKVSVQDRYDSTPNGLKPNDIHYAVLLLWES